MSLVRRLSIGIVRAPVVVDRRGVETRNWAAAATTESRGWSFDAGVTVEDGDGRDGIVSHYTIYGPYDVDLLASDRVVLLGGTYEIDGEVFRQPGPSRRVSSTLVRLKRVAG